MLGYNSTQAFQERKRLVTTIYVRMYVILQLMTQLQHFRGNDESLGWIYIDDVLFAKHGFMAYCRDLVRVERVIHLLYTH